MINTLDDDSLLNIFHLYRPFLLGEADRDIDIRFKGGVEWVGERWWYRLAHVCQRWRNLILGSASYLDLCLVCTSGTPVADMLARSPPLPLVIDCQYHGITAEDQEEIILALKQRDRVRRIRFGLPVLKLQKFIMAINGEYPILEYLILMDPPRDKHTLLILPKTLRTPHLRHLLIDGSILTRYPLVGTAAGLVNLYLNLYHRSIYFQPADLIRSLSLLPQLELLLIYFFFDVSNSDVERQLMHKPVMSNVALPNLRFFALQAVSTYSEAVLSRITSPRLENFQICYPTRRTLSVTELVQFMQRTENIRFDRANFNFENERVYVKVNPPEHNMRVDVFSIIVHCSSLHRQVSSVAQIFNALSQILSVVEQLSLMHQVRHWASEEHNEVERTEWRKLLRSFTNVKTLRVYHGLVKELSRCLRLDDGEHPLELLPKLQSLAYSGSDNANLNDAFTSFIDARKNAGLPVTLIKW